MSGLRFRYLIPIGSTSLCLVVLCTLTAISLFRQQSSLAMVLKENVHSQRVAVELEECLQDIIALEDDRVESVSVLHNRVNLLLARIESVADQATERNLQSRMTQSFREYMEQWKTMPAVNSPGHEESRRSATRFLENTVLRHCQEFEHYNSQRIEESTTHHEQVLRQLAWGLAGIGILGGIAGVLLGYGVARGLARSIRRLQIRVRNAAGMLGPDVPEIVLTKEGEFGTLHAEIDRLSERIEQVVRDLQQRDREVLRAEQLAALGQLAAGVAHEIRNPLTAIKMLIQVNREDSTSLAGDDLRVIEDEVRRMEKSLNTFLEFARPPQLQRKATEIGPLIEDVFGLIRSRAEKQRVVLKLSVPAELQPVTADPEQLRQVFVNLCLNALDAMPSGGRLSIDVRSRRTGVEMELTDTGPGISAAMFPRLFQPFSSSKETGLGLGLVISKRILEAHGGSLNAANRPGGGATFFVWLPTEVTDANRVVD